MTGQPYSRSSARISASVMSASVRTGGPENFSRILVMSGPFR